MAFNAVRAVPPLLLILWSLLGVPIPACGQAAEVIQSGERLSLERCLEIALSRHPSIQGARYTIRAQESRIEQAKSSYLPQVTWQNTYSRNAPYTTSSSRLAGTGAYDQFGSNIGLTQNIYDFQKTPTQVRIARINADATRRDLEQTVSQVILGVKQGFYGLIQAEKNRDVARETVEQFQQHLSRAKGYFDVGLKPKFDVTKAEVDLGNARLNLIRAENTFRIARVNLNNALGVPSAPPDYALAGDLLFQRQTLTLEEAVRQARDNRPDLQSLLLKQESANQAVTLARTAHYPTISGSASYGFGGTEFPLDRGWSVGGALNVPIFSGFLVKNQIAEAQANLEVVKANVAVLEQQIRFEVEQAFSNLKEAEDRVGTTELTVRQAKENVELARGRYAAGVGNPIEVTDALVAQSNAKTAYIAALTDCRTAQANLEKAMGMK